MQARVDVLTAQLERRDVELKACRAELQVAHATHANDVSALREAAKAAEGALMAEAAAAAEAHARERGELKATMSAAAEARKSNQLQRVAKRLSNTSLARGFDGWRAATAAMCHAEQLARMQQAAKQQAEELTQKAEELRASIEETERAHERAMLGRFVRRWLHLQLARGMRSWSVATVALRHEAELKRQQVEKDKERFDEVMHVAKQMEQMAMTRGGAQQQYQHEAWPEEEGGLAAAWLQGDGAASASAGGCGATYWTAHWDDGSECYYYVQDATGESVWDRPEGPGVHIIGE